MYHQFSWLGITSLAEAFLGRSDSGHVDLLFQQRGLTSVGVAGVFRRVSRLCRACYFCGHITGPLGAFLKG